MVTTFSDKLRELLADAQAKLLKDGFSWENLSETILAFIHAAMLAAKDELLNPGPEKKAAVLEWVDRLLDFIVVKMPLPWWLMWLPRASIKSVLLAIASGLIEGLYTQNKEQFSAT